MDGQTNNAVDTCDATSHTTPATDIASSNDDDDPSVLLSSKRTIVLGVVDTTGMKSSVVNRKRRWDQPPSSEEDEEIPPSKVFIREENVVEGSGADEDDKVVKSVTEKGPQTNNIDVTHETTDTPEVPLPVKGNKPDVGVVTVVSDSLKRIQLVYDGGDSTDEEEEEEEEQEEAPRVVKTVESTPVSSDDLIMKACFQIENEGAGEVEEDVPVDSEPPNNVGSGPSEVIPEKEDEENGAAPGVSCDNIEAKEEDINDVEEMIGIQETVVKEGPHDIIVEPNEIDSTSVEIDAKAANGIDAVESSNKSEDFLKYNDKTPAHEGAGATRGLEIRDTLRPTVSADVTTTTPSPQEVSEALRQRTLSTEMELEFDGDSAKTGYYEMAAGAKKPDGNVTDESFSLETFIGKGAVQTEGALTAMVQELGQLGGSGENGGEPAVEEAPAPSRGDQKLSAQTSLSDHSESTSMSLDTFVNSKADKMFTEPETVQNFTEKVPDVVEEAKPDEHACEVAEAEKPNIEIENQADSLASSDTVVMSMGSPDHAVSDDSNVESGASQPSAKEELDSSGSSKLLQALRGKISPKPGTPLEMKSSAVKMNEVEIGNAEIVMVDPTKPLVEEDSLSEKARVDTPPRSSVIIEEPQPPIETPTNRQETELEEMTSEQVSPKRDIPLESEDLEPSAESLCTKVQLPSETTHHVHSPQEAPTTLSSAYDELTVKERKHKEEMAPVKETKPPVLQPGKEIEPPKLSPITLRIFKDNLTIKTELDSPKKRSPLSSELRCSSPSTHSPSSQGKQLEFTLKIARDANTPYPKATMSPKNTCKPSPPIGGSSSPTIWKSEVPNQPVSQQQTEMGVQTSLDDLKVQSPQITDILKKVLLEGGQGGQRPGNNVMPQQQSQQMPLLATALQPGIPQAAAVPPMPEVPVKKKRGRPRKIRPLEDGTMPTTATTPIVVPQPSQVVSPPPFGGDDASHRPVRTCRGRTKPIVTRTRRPRGAGRGGLSRGAMAAARAASLLSMDESGESVGYGPMDADGSPLKIGVLPMIVHSGRGRGAHKQPTPDRETLSAREKAEIERIEERREKMRLEKIAKLEEKKAKKLAKKMKDEERRKRLARERAEKAEAGAPQVFEEETRMSAPDSNSRGHTPAPNKYTGETGAGDESQNSISVTVGGGGNKKGRMEISLNDLDCLVKEVGVDDLAEYQWQGSELYMIQEQVSLYLGVKSFKRKYPHLKRRTVEAEERQYLEDSGLVPKSMCDLGLTAVSSAEILDIMFQDFPDRYEEFRRHCREKQAREAAFKQKGALPVPKKEGRVEPREQALEAVAAYNANLNRERRDERRCALDLQTFTIHYPKRQRDHMTRPATKVGLYPLAVVPGQYCDYYKTYTPTEMMYFPLNTVLYGPLKPNERQVENASDDGSGSDSDESTSSSGDSSDSSSSSDSDDYDDPSKCQSCDGTKKNNKSSEHEDIIQCAGCKLTVHPSCNALTPEMIPHLLKYDWCCLNCKICSKCNVDCKEKLMLSCNLCDRGYHLVCIGLKKMPEGRWHCSVCAYCSSCGSRSPGGSDWQHEFKKGEKGTKIYQRTLCTPCFKLWRKGKYCQICYKCHGMKPEEEVGLMQCNTCERWIHRECFNARYGQPHRPNGNGFQCDLCLERIQSALSSHGIPRALIKV